MEKSLESKAWAQLWTLRITVSVRTEGRGVRPAGAWLTRRPPSSYRQGLGRAWCASFGGDWPRNYLGGRDHWAWSQGTVDFTRCDPQEGRAE